MKAKNIVRTKSFFLYSMLTATFIPFIFAGVAFNITDTNSESFRLLILAIITPLGAHQVATLYFYVDKISTKVIKDDCKTYILIPLILISSCFLLMFYYGEHLKAYIIAVLAAYTIYHYQKQNLGIFSLLSPLLGDGRMSRNERKLIYVAGIAGMLTYSGPNRGVWFADTMLEPLSKISGNISIAITCALVIFASKLLYEAIKLKTSSIRDFIIRWVLLFTFILFYTPLFFMDNLLFAFSIFASAHAIQYFLIMFFITSDGELKLIPKKMAMNLFLKATISLMFFILITVLAWYGWNYIQILAYSSTAPNVSNAFLGLAISFSFVHYHLDSEIWRMSNPKIFKLHKKKLGFILCDRSQPYTKSTISHPQIL